MENLKQNKRKNFAANLMENVKQNKRKTLTANLQRSDSPIPSSSSKKRRHRANLRKELHVLKTDAGNSTSPEQQVARDALA
jgi:L-ribulose-5-phosphate 3-epimerase UlaE